MKKISLKNLNTNEVEQLSREQLKNVLGGYTGGSGDGTNDGITSAPNCKVGTDCTATITKNGVTTSLTGDCTMSTTGTTVSCYCDAATPDQYTTLSNCWG